MSPARPGRQERADVAIIGGGPAGSAVGLRLARRGLHVIQLERRCFGDPGADPFRSGEGALPSTMRELQRLGAADHSAQWTLNCASRVQMRWPNGDVTVDRFPHGRYIRTLDRERFDHALWQSARAAGVDGRRGWNVRGLLTKGESVKGVAAVSPEGEAVRIIAPLVIDAGGRNAPSIRQLDLRRPVLDDDFVVVVLFFDDVADLADDMWEMHFFDHETPTLVQGARVTSNLARFGLGAFLHAKQGRGLSPEAFFWQRLTGYPELLARLRAAKVVRPPYARARLSFKTSAIARNGLLLVGDAAGYLNPILGDGILLALRTAALASDAAAGAFERGDFSLRQLGRYERRLRVLQFGRAMVVRGLVALHARPIMLDRLGHVTAARQMMLRALMRT